MHTTANGCAKSANRLLRPTLLLLSSLSSTFQPAMGFLSPSTTKSHTFNTVHTELQAQQQQHLVLIGGGHAHVQVIKALHARPKHLRVTLIDQQTSASYSGMVPGCIAGRYTHAETQLDLRSLAEWSGLDFVQDTVVDIDCENKRVYVLGVGQEESSSVIPFDVLSLDIGSTTRGLDECPGASHFSIPTRPIDQLVLRLQKIQEAGKLVVIGAGVAGLELSLAAKGRWPNADCLILDAADQLLPGEPRSVQETVQRVLDEKGVQIRHGCRVERIDEEVIYLKDGISRIPYTHCIWATGAGSHALARHLHRVRGLDCDERGWIRVTPTLQSISHPYIFAAGDCSSIQGLDRSPPKAGVYAVRAGPILIENLTRALESCSGGGTVTPLVRYQPQDDFLKLVVCGDGTALGFRFGLVMRGSWVFRLKDKIDRDFMDLFNVKGKPKPERRRKGYDTSQYDDQEQELIQMDPADARRLLLRTDHDVEVQLAQKILKRMGSDADFRNAVVHNVASEVAFEGI